MVLKVNDILSINQQSKIQNQPLNSPEVDYSTIQIHFVNLTDSSWSQSHLNPLQQNSVGESVWQSPFILAHARHGILIIVIAIVSL